MKTGNNEYDNMISGLNKKAWNKIIKQQIGQLRRSLEIEITYCDSILYDIPSESSINGIGEVRNYTDIIENLEYILNDFYKSSSYHRLLYRSETLNCDFLTLETILKEIKESKGQ